MTSYCPVPGLVPASPANRDYKAGFTAAMMLKDLKLAQTAARATHATTPLGLAPPRSTNASSKAAMAASIFPASFVICAEREGGVARFVTSERSPELSHFEPSCLRSAEKEMMVKQT